MVEPMQCPCGQEFLPIDTSSGWAACPRCGTQMGIPEAPYAELVTNEPVTLEAVGDEPRDYNPYRRDAMPGIQWKAGPFFTGGVSVILTSIFAGGPMARSDSVAFGLMATGIIIGLVFLVFGTVLVLREKW